MSVGNFSTANQTYRMLMGNGLTYRVPPFQRDYSWDEEEWDDLWRDIENILSPEGEPAHYMGYLVLQSRDSKNFDIIDGQQRLTTLSIIVLVVLARLQQLADQGREADRNKLRQDQLRGSFIGFLDPVTLLAKSKLTLNRNNDNLYQNYLVPLRQSPRRGLRSTEHKMRRAFEWFDSRLKDNCETGVDLARFVEQIADKLFFTVITVTDELNAYKVFETLNARGVRLSSTDLLKNYLFSVVHSQSQDEHELAELEKRWEALVGKLGSESFPDFLRTHWNSRNRFLRHAELFKRIRDQIRNREQVFALIRNLEEDVDPYVALSRPEDELWQPEQRRYVSDLRMFNVRQVYPLLLAGYRQLNGAEFTQLLRAISIISFRYNVIGNNPTSEQERVYNTVAVRIHQAGLGRLVAILPELRHLYPTDEEFRYAFAGKSLKTTQSRNKRVVRYILFQIEQQCSGNSYDPDSERYNIEHILPENPGEGWNHISDFDHEQLVYRLGNMAILHQRPNRDAGNSPYEQKRLLYEQSEFEITRRIAQENANWDEERIGARQNWMATQATGIWRIAQLS